MKSGILQNSVILTPDVRHFVVIAQAPREEMVLEQNRLSMACDSGVPDGGGGAQSALDILPRI